MLYDDNSIYGLSHDGGRKALYSVYTSIKPSPFVLFLVSLFLGVFLFQRVINYMDACTSIQYQILLL